MIDCFCGSGTIPIEAALIGKNIAPGLNRSFASEEWPVIGKEIWKQERVKALQAIDQDIKLKIYASDISHDAVELAMENAFNAGVDDCIKFSVSDFKNVRINDEYGVIICNPPYGERLGQQQEIALLNKDIGRAFSKYETWSKYIITSQKSLKSIMEKSR